MRRCQEDLEPAPEHPGCIYGEMGMCLRPCQQVVGPAEYGHEVARVVEFLRSGGRSLLEAIERSRDRLSEEMMFEEAARQHKRLEKVLEVLKLRDELARDVERLNGVAITRSRGAGGGGDVVRARRQLAAAAALQLRSAGREDGFARPQAARNVRGGGRRGQTRRFASGRNTWRCWRAGFTPAGATASGWNSKAPARFRIASW